MRIFYWIRAKSYGVWCEANVLDSFVREVIDLGVTPEEITITIKHIRSKEKVIYERI